MTEVSTKQLREHLQLSPPAISKLTDGGVLRRLRRGRWDLDDCRERYLSHLRAVAARHASPDGKHSLVEERARLARAQREKTELETRLKLGELVSVADVERETFAVFRALRETILAVPGRVAADVHAAETLADIETILEAALRAALERLTDGADPPSTTAGDDSPSTVGADHPGEMD